MQVRLGKFLIVIWRLARIALPIAVGLAVVVGVVCWFGGWRSLYEYATALQYAAIAVFIIGGFGLLASCSRLGRKPLRLSDTSILYQQQLGQMDENLYHFCIGGLVAFVLYLFSSSIFSFVG